MSAGHERRSVLETALPGDISAALRTTFGAERIENLAAMAGGLSGSTILSFSVGGAEYVLRKGDASRAPRELACMQIASDRGVAPRLHHADPTTAISIMDRVTAPPFGRAVPPDLTRVDRVATTLRRLHQGPAFPSAVKVPDIVRLMETQLVALSGERLPTDLVRTVDELTACTARYAETAPCHNDLNPNNILVASHRVLFIDWEVACAGDPFVDLAQLGVFAFPRPEERARLLEAYVARSPTDEELARATVTRVLALAFYAAAFFCVRAVAGVQRAPTGPVPLADLAPALAASRERADPGAIATSLLFEMQRESVAPACTMAKRTLAAARSRPVER